MLVCGTGSATKRWQSTSGGSPKASETKPSYPAAANARLPRDRARVRARPERTDSNARGTVALGMRVTSRAKASVERRAAT
jgi:hypothetical protein